MVFSSCQSYLVGIQIEKMCEMHRAVHTAAANKSYVKRVQQMSAAPAFVEATKSSHWELPHTSGNGPFTAIDTLETTGVLPESKGGINNKPKMVAFTHYISICL